MAPSLVWLDLETTGLNPYEGVILEVGVIITDLELNEKDRKSWILQYDRDDTVALMDDYVLNMHLSSGLLKEVWGERKRAEGPCEFRGRLEKKNAEIFKAIVSWINVKTITAPKECYLAGSSIHFDRLWLSAQLEPEKILEKVSHRMGDVSSFKVFFPGLLTQPEGGAAHRALDDLDYSIDQLRQMRALLSIPLDAAAANAVAVANAERDSDLMGGIF